MRIQPIVTLFRSRVADDPLRTLIFPSDAVLTQLQESLSVLSVELVPIHQRLVALRRQLVALAAKPKPSKTDLKPLQEELRKIDS